MGETEEVVQAPIKGEKTAKTEKQPKRNRKKERLTVFVAILVTVLVGFVFYLLSGESMMKVGSSDSGKVEENKIDSDSDWGKAVYEF